MHSESEKINTNREIPEHDNKNILFPGVNLNKISDFEEYQESPIKNSENNLYSNLN